MNASRPPGGPAVRKNIADFNEANIAIWGRRPYPLPLSSRTTSWAFTDAVAGVRATANAQLPALLYLGFDRLMLRASASRASAIELYWVISTLAAPGM